jgi:hypothetical protein
MSTLRFFAILFIFGGVSLAWLALGGSVTIRSTSMGDSLASEMDNRFGPSVVAQVWPKWQAKGDTRTAWPDASKITAHITHENRNMGLMWYSTFAVRFDAQYRLAAGEGAGAFIFVLPAGVTKFDDLRVSVDESNIPVSVADLVAGQLRVPLDRSAEHVVRVAYTTYGRDVFVYSPSPAASGYRVESDTLLSLGNAQIGQLQDFSLTITTDFADIDYPKGSSSPTSPAADVKGGKVAEWKYANALTKQAMGVVVPRPVNAGPVTARMSFFAPVSLLFFFTALFTVGVLKKVSLHPMHYLFLSAAFFAFHILMAYLVDVVTIQPAFWISAAVSVLLVVSYMRLVAGAKFAVVYVGLAQLVFLVGYSFAFFWVGKTGLTITIAAIATLFVLMQATGRLNWHEVFNRPKWEPVPPPPPKSPM